MSRSPRRIASLGSCTLPTRFGSFRMEAFEVAGVAAEFICVSMGRLEGSPPPLVRLHSECLTGDTLGSLRCDCGQQLEEALDRISSEKRGLLMYLRQEGRGIGLVNKIRAYRLQEGGLDTIDANLALGLPVDSREYISSAHLLKHLGLLRIRLLTNNLSKCRALSSEGIEIAERVPITIKPNPSNEGYLRTKARRMGHVMEHSGGQTEGSTLSRTASPREP